MNANGTVLKTRQNLTSLQRLLRFKDPGKAGHGHFGDEELEQGSGAQL
jgi:hypothetical protein